MIETVTIRKEEKECGSVPCVSTVASRSRGGRQGQARVRASGNLPETCCGRVSRRFQALSGPMRYLGQLFSKKLIVTRKRMALASNKLSVTDSQRLE